MLPASTRHSAAWFHRIQNLTVGPSTPETLTVPMRNMVQIPSIMAKQKNTVAIRTLIMAGVLAVGLAAAMFAKNYMATGLLVS